jgi:hypothetical protein
MSNHSNPVCVSLISSASPGGDEAENWAVRKIPPKVQKMGLHLSLQFAFPHWWQAPTITGQVFAAPDST